MGKEAPRRHPRGTHEAPRRHPGGTQEAPRGTQGTQEPPRGLGSKKVNTSQLKCKKMKKRQFHEAFLKVGVTKYRACQQNHGGSRSPGPPQSFHPYLRQAARTPTDKSVWGITRTFRSQGRPALEEGNQPAGQPDGCWPAGCLPVWAGTGIVHWPRSGCSMAAR